MWDMRLKDIQVQDDHVLDDSKVILDWLDEDYLLL